MEKRSSYERLQHLYSRISGSTSSSEVDEGLARELRERVDRAMLEDLNTPEAVAAVFEVAGRVGAEISARPEAVHEFRALAEVLADALTIFGFDLAEESEAEVNGIRVRYVEQPEAGVLDRVAEREGARRFRDWALADRLRDELKAEGWVVEDTPDGPVLSRR